MTSEGAPFAPAQGWRPRAAAAGKMLLFLLATAIGVALIGLAAFSALMMGLHLKPQDLRHAVATGSPGVLLANEIATTGGVLLATLLLARVFNEPVARFGLGVGQGARRRLRDLGLGLACGFGLLTALLAAIAALGGLSFGGIVEGPAQALGYGALYALLFGLVAVSEEATFRGYALVQLSRALGFWPAAVVLAVLFGAVHAGNASETPVGLASAGAIGLVLAYSFLRSGSLMWALGFHAAWDYAQSFVWGVPDSGVVTPGTLFRAQVHGAPWLTGGAAGPEASWLVAPAILAAFGLAHVCLRGARRP